MLVGVIVSMGVGMRLLLQLFLAVRMGFILAVLMCLLMGVYYISMCMFMLGITMSVQMGMCNVTVGVLVAMWHIAII